jgi:hypothetical protein
MGLHIAGLILTSWLLITAWLSSDRQYFGWSYLVIFLWWIAWVRSKPRWPAALPMQLLVYTVFFVITVLLAGAIRSLPATIVPVGLTALIGLDFFLASRRRRPTE